MSADEHTPTTEQVRHAADWDRSWIVKGPEFDRWLERVRAEERERCLKAVEAVQRAMRDLADEKDPEERLLLRASANGMGGALAAIRAVSEQRAALKGGK